MIRSGAYRGALRWPAKRNVTLASWTRASSAQALDIDEDTFDSDRRQSSWRSSSESQELGKPVSLTCKAHYVARDMDILRVCQRVYGSAAHRVGRDSIIITGPFEGPSWESPSPQQRRRWAGNFLHSENSRSASNSLADRAGRSDESESARAPFASSLPPQQRPQRPKQNGNAEPREAYTAAGAQKPPSQQTRGRGIVAAAAVANAAAAASEGANAALHAAGLRRASGRAGPEAETAFLGSAAAADESQQAALWGKGERSDGATLEPSLDGSEGTVVGYNPCASSHVVVYKYGSVVFFNLSEEAQKLHISRIRRECTNSVPVDQQQEEDVSVKVWRGLPSRSHVERDCVMVRELDPDHISVVSSVMGQTVALEFYKLQANRMMEEFARLNAGVENTGMFSKMDKIALFKLVAKNNGIMTDVLYKLGLLERLDLAWRNSQYHDMWESLRTEYELMQRFKDLELKLNLIQHNTKFFVDVLHNQKSDMLEWTIIGLIAAEIAISVAGLLDYNPFA